MIDIKSRVHCEAAMAKVTTAEAAAAVEGRADRGGQRPQLGRLALRHRAGRAPSPLTGRATGRPARVHACVSF